MKLIWGATHLVVFRQNSGKTVVVVVVQLLNCVWLFATPWTTERQASLPLTISWSLPKFMSIESVMLSNHLILCCPERRYCFPKGILTPNHKGLYFKIMVSRLWDKNRSKYPKELVFHLYLPFPSSLLPFVYRQLSCVKWIRCFVLSKYLVWFIHITDSVLLWELLATGPKSELSIITTNPQYSLAMSPNK